MSSAYWSALFVACICLMSTSGVLSQAPTLKQCSAQCIAGQCDNATGICYKCGDMFFVYIPSGLCADSCPAGKDGSRIFTGVPKTFHGLVCMADISAAPSAGPTGTAVTSLAASGLSGAATGAIIGGCVGILIIIAGVLFVVYFFHSRREHALAEASTHVNMRDLRQAPSNSNLRQPNRSRQQLGGIDEEETDASQPTRETPDDTVRLSPKGGHIQPQAELTEEERAEFFSRLDEIRPNAATLLEILNATNKVRRSTDDKAEAARLKLAMDDMATVLHMVHRKTKKLTIPGNGLLLVAWATGLVSSYKRSQTEVTEEAM